MIKPALDTIRAVRGYSGMTVYHCRKLFFTELIDETYAAGLMSLFLACREGHVPGSSYVVTGGYTIHLIVCGDYQLIAKIAGRFAPPPYMPGYDPDFIDPDPVHGLPLREDARKLAEDLLREYGFNS